MKKVTLILFMVLVLFASCEKSTDQPYTLKFYGDVYEDIGYSVAQVSDGYVIAGQVEDIKRDSSIITRNKNMGIIKTGWDGNVLWKKSYGGKLDDWGSKIYQLDDGSLICTGTFTTDAATTLPVQTDVFVVKISSTGDPLWQKTFGGPGNQTGTDLVKTQDGFIILGTTDAERPPVSDSTGNISGKTDIYLLKINDNGDFVESFAYGYPGNDVGTVIKPDIGGDYIVFGTTDRSYNTDQAKNNLILIKINSVGYAKQTRIIGEKTDEYAGDMEVLSDGYLITWTVGKEGDNQKICASKLKEDIHATPLFPGTEILIPDVTSCNVKAMSRYKADSYVLAGQEGKGSSAEMLIFEMDAEGKVVNEHVMKKGSTGVQVAYDVISTDDEYIIAVGKNSYDVNSMITFLKFKF